MFALVQGVLAIVAAYWGYGNVVPPSNLEDALKVGQDLHHDVFRTGPLTDFGPTQATYASQPLYIASLWACKCSGVLLVARLSPMGPVYRSCKAVAYFTTFWAVASILAVSLRGDLLHPWLTIDGSDIVVRPLAFADPRGSRSQLNSSVVGLAWRLLAWSSRSPSSSSSCSYCGTCR